jgi:hypothetical protein
MDENFKRKKGSFQHKLFKVVILVIVAVFFYLIYSFVKIEFFKSTSDNDYSMQINNEKYEYLEKLESNFIYSKNKENLDECDLDNFYSDNLNNHKPCIVKYNTSTEAYLYKIESVLIENKLKTKPNNIKTSDNQINLQGVVNKIGFLDFMEYLEYENLYLRYAQPEKEITKAIAKDNNYFFLQLDKSKEFRLSPITQIRKFSIIKKDSGNKYYKFNQIEISDDLFSLSNSQNENMIILKAKLEKGDMLFVPSYFFIQMRELEEGDITLKFEFKPYSRLLDTLFKVLYDDSYQTEENEYF